MAQSLTVLLKTELPAGQFKTDKGREVQAQLLSGLLRDLASGAKHANLDVFVSTTAPVAASQTITCDQSAATADDTVDILGVTLTAKASGASTDEFNIGADDAALATNLAAAINTNTTLAKYVTASASAAVVTVALNFKGSIGNYLVASSATVDAGTPFTFSNSGSFASGAGGIEGDAQNYSLGL